jgi:antitoxin PrlF
VINVKSSLIVSPRGQITLPSELRKKFGIKEGGVVTVEERNGEIVLRPAAVLEIEMYSNAQVAQWDQEDKLDDSTRAKLKKKIGKRT